MGEYKDSLFISYCWKDGNYYADELETQLKDYFDVRRDKSKLSANDDIYEFMSTIAACDNVVIVLTENYLKSINCMLELSFLLQQPDWSDKAMVLVIDETIYDTERQLSVLSYWNSKLATYSNAINVSSTLIFDDEKHKLELINSMLETFITKMRRRQNPSQIAIVNELYKKMQYRNSMVHVDSNILKGEQRVKEYIAKYGDIKISQIKELGYDEMYGRRLVYQLTKNGVLTRTGSGKETVFTFNRSPQRIEEIEKLGRTTSYIR